MTDPVSTAARQGELAQAHAPYIANIRIHARKDLEKELDFVVDDAIMEASRRGGPGIVVTRNSPSSFTVELSEEVPYGTIFERTLH
jgi:hypothetical protein